MKTFTAQDLYDCQEEFGDISGTDLHDLFRFLCGGEPSPAGRTPISTLKLLDAWHDFGDKATTEFIDRVIGHDVTHYLNGVSQS